ncbi:MAG: hypothetical protein D6698_05640 [Gammaproteobacteria bacterium]|nr:MAG: hypothetical protein D6698_05640 [Gammaproteobacteria bacterium]
MLDEFLRATFLDMFGDPITNPKGWVKMPIGEVFEVVRGGSPRPIQDYLTDSENGLNWIMIGDAAEGARYISSTKKKIKREGLNKTRQVKEGDLLLTNSMSFGRPYLLKTSGCIHDGWLALSPKSEAADPEFFCSLLGVASLYQEFAKKAAGAVVKNLNTKLVNQVRVPIPPLDFQRQWAEIIQGAESKKSRLQNQLAELDSLFASLQSRAFRGEL